MNLARKDNLHTSILNRSYESVISDTTKNITTKSFISISFHEFKCLSFYSLISSSKTPLTGVMPFVLLFGIFPCLFNSVSKMFNIVDLGVSPILKNARFPSSISRQSTTVDMAFSLDGPSHKMPSH